MRNNQSPIHPTAIIEEGAVLGEDVQVGAYAYIGPQVVLGARTVVHHHATVEGLTVLGEDNEIFPYAYIGGKTHDLKYKGGTPGLRVGSRNVFREYVTIHTATKEGEWTVLGSNNVILAYSHIAHDCQVGNHLVMSSQAALGGHVIVGDHVNIGWGAGVHQFCRLGDYSMVGACSKLVQDVLPYMIADGNPAEVRTVNRVGLQRHGLSEQAIEQAKGLFKLFYRCGLNRTQALEAIEAEYAQPSEEVERVLTFIKQSSRGLA